MRRARLLLPALCFLTAPLFAALPTGRAISRALEAGLSERGFFCERERLAATAQDEFPFNLLVYPYRADEAQGSGRDTVVFSFMQEEAYAHFDDVAAFLRRLAEAQLPCTVVALFAAQDDSPFNFALSGSGVFAQNVEDIDRTAAVAVRFSDTTAILTGGFGIMTPRWLAQQLTEAFARAKVRAAYPHRFASLYRAGFLRGERRMATFIWNGIPAATVTLAGAGGLDALATFAERFSSKGTAQWDNHYLHLPRPLARIWIGERFLLLLCLTLGTLFLLTVCTSPLVGRGGTDYRQEFRRTWYLIPLTIAVTFGAFWLGQTFCSAVLPRASLVVQFGTKLVFALFFIAVLFAAWQSSRFSTAQFTDSFFISLVGIGNIFVFSAVDISLLSLFLLEYALIGVARRARHVVPLALSFLLMLLPFLPYVFVLLRNGYHRDLLPLVFSPPQYNLLLALLVFPFLIMWLRLLTRLHVYAHTEGFSLKKIAVRGSLSTLVVIAATGLLITALALLSRQTMHRAPATIHAVEDDRGSLAISVQTDEEQGMTMRSITVMSQTNAAHYDVTLTAKTVIPLFDASYDYTVNEETKTATFTVPDFPPQTMTIAYVTDTDDDVTFTVTAWYATDDALTFRKETQATVMRGSE